MRHPVSPKQAIRISPQVRTFYRSFFRAYRTYFEANLSPYKKSHTSRHFRNLLQAWTALNKPNAQTQHWLRSLGYMETFSVDWAVITLEHVSLELNISICRLGDICSIGTWILGMTDVLEENILRLITPDMIQELVMLFLDVGPLLMCFLGCTILAGIVITPSVEFLNFISMPNLIQYATS